MLDSKLRRCPVHGYIYVAVDTDSNQLYQVKCPLKDCGNGIIRPDVLDERRGLREGSDAQAQG